MWEEGGERYRLLSIFAECVRIIYTVIPGHIVGVHASRQDLQDLLTEVSCLLVGFPCTSGLLAPDERFLDIGRSVDWMLTKALSIYEELRRG